MRPDIAKVMCEKERSGSRDDSKAVARFNAAFKPQRDSEERHEEYADLDCLPRYEGMMARIKHNWGDGKDFGENLSVLRGLVVKNVGKNWDKIYSQLCKLASPNGSNTQRHIFQHLFDYIEAETKMIDGEVHCHGSFHRPGYTGSINDWIPLKKYAVYHSRRADNGYFYYVHPKTRCIVRYKLPKEQQRQPKEITSIINSDSAYVKLNGVWWELEVVENYQRMTRVRDWYSHEFVNRLEWAYKDITVAVYKDGIKSHTSVRDFIRLNSNLAVISKRQLNSKELRQLKICNDEIKDPVWKRTKSGWKNIA